VRALANFCRSDQVGDAPRITEGRFIAPDNVRALTPPRSSIAKHYRGTHERHGARQLLGVSSPNADITKTTQLILFGHCTALLVSAIFLDSVLAKAQRSIDRDANAKRSGCQSTFKPGPF
jgi:hypothetical protein